MALKFSRGRVLCKCKHCGHTFSTQLGVIKRGGGKYCSLECNYAHKAKLKKKCQYCENVFLIYRTYVERGEGKYCSLACAHAASVKSVVHACLVCGKSFSVSEYRVKHGYGKYCSRACQHEGASQKVACTCEVCGKDMLVQPYLYKRAKIHCCSKRCSGIAARSVDYDPDGRRTVRSSAWRDSVYRRDGWCCQLCGVKSSRKTEIQAHHILPWSLYPKQRYVRANGITLCVLCHAAVHKIVGRSRRLGEVSMRVYKQVVKPYLGES